MGDPLIAQEDRAPEPLGIPDGWPEVAVCASRHH